MHRGLLLIVCWFACWAVAPARASDLTICEAGGDADGMIQACTKYLVAHNYKKGDSAGALANRGWAYAEKGDYDRAIADYDKAIALAPDYDSAFHSRGYADYMKGDYNRSIADYSKYIELKPDDPTAYYTRGLAYGLTGERDKALADYSKAIELNRDDPQAYYQRGLIYSSTGNDDKAIADYDRAIELKADNPEVYYRRGLAYDGKNDEKALADYDKAIELAPENADYLEMRVGHYISKGDYDRAIADYGKMIELKPGNGDLLRYRGSVYFLKGDYDRVIADNSHAIELKPDDTQAYFNRGLAYERKHDATSALADFQSAARLTPDNATMWGDHVKEYATSAATLLQEAMAAPAAQADAALVRAIDLTACKANDDENAAIRACTAIIVAHTYEARDIATAFASRASINARRSDPDHALADYEQAILLQPDDPQLYLFRGGMQVTRAYYDLALADFNKAIELKPDQREAYYSRAIVFAAKHDKASAVADLQTVVRLSPDGDPMKAQATSDMASLDTLMSTFPKQADLAPSASTPAAVSSPTSDSPSAPAATAGASVPVEAGRRVALVIGNGTYRNAALANPLFDADLITASLRKIGFEVDEVKDADFTAFDAAVTDFAAKEDGADIALFYFAGHGFAMSDGLRPRNYLMTTSADLQATSDALLRRDGVPLDEVIDRISKPAKITLAFIDACRNDPFHRGGGDRGFARVDIELSKQLYVGMSTELGKTALDGEDGKGSPFAQAFAETIVTPGLRIDDAFRQLREEVSQKTDGKQEPEILQDDLKQGSIVLVGAGQAALSKPQ